MPTYEFTCPDGHDFDKFFRSMASAPTVVPCPVCGKPADRQVSAGAGLVFHGTGFYITDYGKDGKKDQRIAGGHRTDATPKDDSATGSHAGDAGSTSADSQSDSSSSTSSPPDSKPDGAVAAPTPAAPTPTPATSKATE